MLQHKNGTPLVKIFGPKVIENRSGTIALNLLDPNGRQWSPSMIEYIANEFLILIRTGNHCNPGANEEAQQISKKLLERIYNDVASNSIDDFLWENEEHVPGVVRVSIGLVSNFKDVLIFKNFLKAFLNKSANEWE